jgi:transposase
MTLTIMQRIHITWRLGQSDPNYGSRQIGLEVGCSHETVINIGRRWLTEQTIEYKPKSGRPRKTTLEQDQAIIVAAVLNKTDSVTEVMAKIKDVQINISNSTLNSRLLGNF